MTRKASLPELPERFELRERLGAGGFGQVYCAFDHVRDELVALKILSEVNTANLLSFKSEFRSVSGMHHPNLVTLYELIEHSGLWFFTMELVHGTDFLSHVCEQIPLAPPSSLIGGEWPTALAEATPTDEITFEVPDRSAANSLAMRFTDTFIDNLVASPHTFDQTAAPKIHDERLRASLRELYHGVSALHHVGILHRDIKPSNVVVEESGRLVLLDFGLISAIKPELRVELPSLADSSSSKSRHIHYIGTPHYMSPEQAMGEQVGPASDWYSVGIMLYEALAGRRPIEASSPLQILVQKNAYDPIDVRELNSEAPADLAELCMRLLARDPLLRPSASEIAATLDIREDRAVFMPAMTQAMQRALVPPFVGRAYELDTLHAAVEELHSDPIVLHVSGPSGMGKSALVERFLDDLERRTTFDPSARELLVLRGRCFRTESVPYKALDDLVDALSEHLEFLKPEEMPPLLGIELAALSILFPTLEERFEDISEQSEVLSRLDSTSLQLTAFSALRSIIGFLARRHTLICYIDDAHWGDEDSALLLEHVLRPTDSPPALFLFAWRCEERDVSAFLESLFAAGERWGDAMRTIELTLGELDHGEREELVERLFAERGLDRQTSEHIVSESQGNPLFLNELAYHVSTLAPTPAARTLSLDDILYARVEALGDTSKSLLECVCVAGQPIERSLARKISRVEGDEQSSLSMLRSELMLRFTSRRARVALDVSAPAEGDLLDVYHARIREAVLHRMERARLITLHGDLALALGALEGGDPERIAHHYIEAKRPKEAIPFLLLSSERAERALAMEQAARALSTALDYGEFHAVERAEHLLRLGEIYGYIGRGLDAVGAYEEAMELLPPARHESIEHRIAEQLLRVGRFEQGRARMFALLAEHGITTPRGNARLLAEIAALRAKLAWRGLDVDESRVTTRAVTREQRKAEVLWSAAQMLSVTDLKLGAYFASYHLLEALEQMDADHLCLALTLEGVHLSGSAKGRARARDLLRRAEALLLSARDRGYCSGFVAFGWGMLLYLEGDCRTARDHFRRAEQILSTECKGVVWELDGARFYQLFCEEHLGGFSHYVQKLPVYLDLATRRQDLLYATNWRLWSYLLHLVRDQPTRAEQEVDHACRMWKSDHFLIQHFWALIARSKIALYRHEPVWSLDLIDSQYNALKRSLLLQNETVDLLIEEAQAQLTLALLLDRQLDARQTRRLRARCERHVQKMRRGSLELFWLRARGVTLQLAWLDGERRTALREAESLSREVHVLRMLPYFHALNMLRALMMGLHEEAAQDLFAEATAWFESEGVLHPAAFARTLCPLLVFLPS